MAYSGELYTSFADRILNTLNDLRRAKNDPKYYIPLNSYACLSHLLPKMKERTTGGKLIQGNYTYGVDAQTKIFFNALEERNPLMFQRQMILTAPFARAGFPVTYVEDDLLECSGPAKIVDTVWKETMKAELAFWTTVEEGMYDVPDLTNEQQFYGLPYTFTPITTVQAATSTAAGDWQGGNAYGMSDTYGATPSATNKFYNYNFCWEDSNGTLGTTSLKRLNTAFMKMQYNLPPDLTSAKNPEFSDVAVLTDMHMIHNMGDAARAQNSQMGSDILKYYNGQQYLNNIPVRWAQPLDTNLTSNNDLIRGGHALYCVNTKYYGFIYDPRRWGKPYPPDTDGTHQPDRTTVWTDFKGNTFTDDIRKAGFIGSWVA